MVDCGSGVACPTVDGKSYRDAGFAPGQGQEGVGAVDQERRVGSVDAEDGLALAASSAIGWAGRSS